MVSGSRGISICKAAVSRYSPTTHRDYREPLLFLYPTWARGFGSSTAEAVLQERPVHHSRSTSDPQQASLISTTILQTRTAERRPVPQKQPSREDSSRSSPDVGQLISNPKVNTDADNNNEPKASCLPGGHTANHSSSQKKLEDSSFRTRPLQPPCHVDIRPGAPTILSVNNKDTTQIHQQSGGENASTSKVRKVQNLIVRRFIKSRKILTMANRSEMRLQYDEAARGLLDELVNGKKHLPQRRLPDILDALIRYTPKRVGNTLLRISVPGTAVEELLFGADINIMDIRTLTGCDIDLLEAEGGKSTRTLVLSGPPICISAAATYVFRIIPTAVSNSTASSFTPFRYSSRAFNTDIARPADKCDGQPNVTQYHLVAGQANDLPTRADKIPKPKILTKRSLESYIRSLTRIKLTGPLHKIMYRSEDHINIVATRLLEVFDSQDCMDVMSTTALNEAASYLVKNNRISSLREIFDKTRKAGFPMTTESFNIILRGCAKAQTINTYGAVLHVMVQSGYYVNSATWVAFIMLLRSSKFISQAITAMNERGLFYEEGLLRDICNIIIPHELNFCLDNNLLVDAFIERMRSRFGNEWLSLSGANKALVELSKRGLISECWAFVEYMVEQNIMPDPISINTILAHSADSEDLLNSLKALDRVSNKIGFLPNGVTYDILFNLAWKYQFYSTARIVWKRACLDACVGFQMRKRVALSLVSAVRFQRTVIPSLPGPRPYRGYWSVTAGPFITMRSLESTPIAKHGARRRRPIYRRRARFRASIVVQADQKLFKKQTTSASLTKLLVGAVRRDRDFARIPEHSFEKAMEHLIKYTPVVRTKLRISPSESDKRREAAHHKKEGKEEAKRKARKPLVRRVSSNILQEMKASESLVTSQTSSNVAQKRISRKRVTVRQTATNSRETTASPRKLPEFQRKISNGRRTGKLRSRR